jgi:hypothetical protein
MTGYFLLGLTYFPVNPSQQFGVLILVLIMFVVAVARKTSVEQKAAIEARNRRELERQSTVNKLRADPSEPSYDGFRSNPATEPTEKSR